VSDYLFCAILYIIIIFANINFLIFLTANHWKQYKIIARAVKDHFSMDTATI